MLEVSPEKSQLQERRSKRSKNIWNTGSYLFCFFNNTWFVYSASFVNKTKTMANMITPNSRSFIYRMSQKQQVIMVDDSRK